MTLFKHLFKYLKFNKLTKLNQCIVCDNIRNNDSITCIVCNNKSCYQCFINTYEGTVCSNCVTHSTLNLERERITKLNIENYTLKKKNKELETLNNKRITDRIINYCKCCDYPVTTQKNGIWSCFYCSNLNTTNWKHKDCPLNNNEILLLNIIEYLEDNENINLARHHINNLTVLKDQLMLF